MHYMLANFGLQIHRSSKRFVCCFNSRLFFNELDSFYKNLVNDLSYNNKSYPYFNCIFCTGLLPNSHLRILSPRFWVCWHIAADSTPPDSNRLILSGPTSADSVFSLICSIAGDALTLRLQIFPQSVRPLFLIFNKK